jgi:teichuronic acid biosynthesis glycosyltransferase TuaG
MENLVSVIMPAYNAEKFIAEAIQSVINQSWKHWELLIVNDGSKDRTEAIVQSFSDSRIRYFSQPNKGVSAARNMALDNMRGDFFCFLDADDVLPANSLQDRIAVFHADANIQFVDGEVVVFDEGFNHILRTWRPEFKGFPLEGLVRIDNRIFFGPSWMIRRQSGKMYRMDETLRYCEDLFFYISIAGQGEYSYTSACILHYRKNSGSAMSNLDGLANGYTRLRTRISETVGNRVSWMSRWILFFKIRKIMFLSYLSAGKYRKAFQYLVSGTI